MKDTAAGKRERIKEAILDAAVNEFARHGIRGASMQAIADCIGISKAKLYYYITSKEDLYEQAIVHILHIWYDLFSIDKNSNNPEEFIRKYVTRQVRVCLEHPEISQLYSSEILRGAPVLRKYWHESKDVIEQGARKIEEWVAKGEMRAVDPILLQMNIWAVSDKYALHRSQIAYLTGSESPEKLDDDRILREAIDLFLVGCGIKSSKADTPVLQTYR
ncbi:MAG: TetR family transcriptional regulator C-terminal domain-containing protein [Rhizobiaceae bacterium]